MSVKNKAVRLRKALARSVETINALVAADASDEAIESAESVRIKIVEEFERHLRSSPAHV